MKNKKWYARPLLRELVEKQLNYQLEIANKINLTPEYFSNIINCKNSAGITAVKKICKYFKKKINELFIFKAVKK